MKQTRNVEIGTGLFVLLGVSALFFLTTQTSNQSFTLGSRGYSVTAQFDQVGGLKVRSPVSIAGVSIGQVEDISFDPQLFVAVVTMRIEAPFDQIPSDSTASILTSGLLGGQYVGLTPGVDEEVLADGDQIFSTEPALVLEKLISKYLFSGGKDKKEEEAK